MESQSSFASLLRLMRYARGYRRRVMLASASSIINKLFDIAPEILIGIAIDVVVNKDTSFVASFGFDTPQQQILALAVLTFFIWAGESLFQYFYLVLWRNLAQDLQADMRLNAYVHMQKQSMSFFEDSSTGDLVAILNDDVNQLERFLDGGANEIIQVFVSVIAVGAVFFYLSPIIAVLAFSPIPLIIWGAFFFLHRASPLYAEVRRRVGVLSGRLQNNIGGIATIKSFTAEQIEASRLQADSSAYADSNRRAIAVSSAFIPVIRMAVLAGFLCTFVLGGIKTLDGELGVGAYGVLVFLTQRLLWPLTSLAQTIDLFERAMASTRRILGLLDTPVDIRDDGNLKRPDKANGTVCFDDVSFRYNGNGAGVDGFSIQVPGGTTLALVGATGSGKSTLIKLLLRFYSPRSGGISLDGIAIDQLPLSDLRGAIGFVSQEPFLFEGSIRENIAYGDPRADESAIILAAKQAEAWEFIEKLVDGLDTPVGERGIKLSGGQRQRLALARALLKDPQLLVLDEATSAVDNETEAAIQRSLRSIAQGRTVIMIAHRLSTVVHAEQIVVLADGKIVEQGDHQSLLAAKGHYHSQWLVQTGRAA